MWRSRLEGASDFSFLSPRSAAAPLSSRSRRSRASETEAAKTAGPALRCLALPSDGASPSLPRLRFPPGGHDVGPLWASRSCSPLSKILQDFLEQFGVRKSDERRWRWEGARSSLQPSRHRATRSELWVVSREPTQGNRKREGNRSHHVGIYYKSPGAALAPIFTTRSAAHFSRAER